MAAVVCLGRGDVFQTLLLMLSLCRLCPLPSPAPKGQGPLEQSVGWATLTVCAWHAFWQPLAGGEGRGRGLWASGRGLQSSMGGGHGAGTVTGVAVGSRRSRPGTGHVAVHGEGPGASLVTPWTLAGAPRESERASRAHPHPRLAWAAPCGCTPAPRTRADYAVMLGSGRWLRQLSECEMRQGTASSDRPAVTGEGGPCCRPFLVHACSAWVWLGEAGLGGWRRRGVPGSLPAARGPPPCPASLPSGPSSGCCGVLRTCLLP